MSLLQQVILAHFLCLAFIMSSSFFVAGSNIGASQFNQSQQQNSSFNSIQCYTCLYIENSPNNSNVGCERTKVPTNYLTHDCMGLGSLNALAAVRQVTDQFGRVNDPANVHCVNIIGTSTTGGRVIMRGCDVLPANTTYKSLTCVPEARFPFPPHGFIDDVQFCHCQGKGCNGSSGQARVATGALFMAFISYVKLVLA